MRFSRTRQSDFASSSNRNKKSTSKSAFLKMVPLKRRTPAFSLRRHLPRLAKFRSAMRFRTFVAPESPFSLIDTNAKRALKSAPFALVPLKRIGLSTPPLPRVCSTTELQRRNIKCHHTRLFSKIKNFFQLMYFCAFLDFNSRYISLFSAAPSFKSTSSKNISPSKFSGAFK